MASAEAIESHVDIDAVEREWDELAIRVGAWPFLRPAWIRAWWAAFGKGELSVLTLRRGNLLAGVLPLARVHHLIKSPTNWHTPVYGPVAEDGDAARALLAAALAQRPRRLELSFLDPAGHGLGEMRGLATDYSFSERVVVRSPYLDIEGEWDAYFASRSKNHRSSVRRTERRLEEMGELQLDVVDGGERLGELLEEAFRIEASSWKGEAGTAIASSAETRDFYEEAAAWASRAGLLRLAFLRLDGRAIAIHISLEDERSHYLLKTGFEPELQALGPGRLLLGKMIRRSFELGHQTYEFLGSDAPYKLRWTDTCRDLVEAQLFAPSPSGRLDRFVQTRGLPAARTVRARIRR